MEKHYNVAIIGGGASGLFAGTILGKKAIILEKGDICGRKLLLTGGGRCNYTHNSTLPELLTHYNYKNGFINHALYTLTPDDIIKYFISIGIEPKIEENGKVFPLIGDSHSVLNALFTECQKKKCTIKTGFDVRAITKTDIFKIDGAKESITADYIILALGGNSYLHTGSDGFGYTLAKSFGHKIINPTPALAPLRLSLDLLKAEGISLKITINVDKKEYIGDVVITKMGLSGPLAEDISFMLPQEKEITISFLTSSLIDIQKLRKENGKLLVKNAINLPSRLTSILLGSIADKKVATLKKEDEKIIINQLTKLKCTAKAISKGAMSTHGGIMTDEINPKTMESKIVKGLFFAGDIVDVDANCGGYSLTWAFASAFLASKSIAI